MSDIERPTLTQYDNLEKWRCPQLGGPVKFEYCRRMNLNLPCNQLYKCWNESLDVDQYVKENFTEEENQKVFVLPSRGRMGTIFDVLNRVQAEKQE